jgi:hypothetical protein
MHGEEEEVLEKKKRIRNKVQWPSIPWNKTQLQEEKTFQFSSKKNPPFPPSLKRFNFSTRYPQQTSLLLLLLPPPHLRNHLLHSLRHLRHQPHT